MMRRERYMIYFDGRRGNDLMGVSVEVYPKNAGLFIKGRVPSLHSSCDHVEYRKFKRFLYKQNDIGDLELIRITDANSDS